MQWWFWSVGTIIILFVALAFNREFHLGKLQCNLLDIAVVPLWLCLHYTMGYRFGVSWWAWLLMGWSAIGIVLSWFLFQKQWSLRIFWRRFWVWSGLFAILMQIFVTIIGFISH